MDFLPVWVSAVNILEPFIRKSGEAVAEKAGKALYHALEQRFKKKKDAQAKKVLKNYAQDADIYRQALEIVLQDRAKETDFRDWLVQQVHQTSGSSPASAGRVRVEVTASGHVQMGDVIGQVGGDVVKGSKTSIKK